MTKPHELPKELKTYMCLYTVENHRTFRMMLGDTVDIIDHQLKTNIGKNKVTAKRYYEIDSLTGNFEEF